jgi:hypothetical protein
LYDYKLRYVQYDNVVGTVLGFSKKPIINIEEDWITISDEAYQKIINANTEYVIDVNSIDHRLREYRKRVRKYYKFPFYKKLFTKITFVVVHIEDVIKKPPNLKSAIIARQNKNEEYCQMYIEDGIYYDGKHYSFSPDEQNQYLENRLYGNYFIHRKDNNTYENEFLTEEEFIDIHNKLIENRNYHYFYLEQLNNYTATLTNVEEVRRIKYETKLPQEYIDKIEQNMKTVRLMKNGNIFSL